MREHLRAQRRGRAERARVQLGELRGRRGLGDGEPRVDRTAARLGEREREQRARVLVRAAQPRVAQRAQHALARDGHAVRVGAARVGRERAAQHGDEQSAERRGAA